MIPLKIEVRFIKESFEIIHEQIKVIAEHFIFDVCDAIFDVIVQILHKSNCKLTKQQYCFIMRCSEKNQQFCYSPF